MTVVVGWVPRPEGRAALEHALKEAWGRRTTLELLVEDDHRQRLTEELDAARGRTGTDDLEVRVSPASEEGRSAAEVMVDASYRRDVDLLVIGLRRRSPVGKLLLGSTSQRILLDADCPVTAVKPPVTAEG